MKDQKERLENLRKSLFIKDKREKVVKLEERLSDESLWDDWEEGQKVSQDHADLKRDIDDFEMLELILADNDLDGFEK